MKKILVMLVFAFSTNTIAQTTDKKDINLEFKGFVRTDAFFDSRNTISLREGAILLMPANKSLDISGGDIYDRSSLTAFAFHTRLAGSLSGPEVFGAKSSAYFEGEFFGNSDSDIHGFRLRHGFTTLDWGTTSILFGQFWHPLFSTNVIPSFNFAVPFIPFSRNPQIKFTQKFSDVSLIIALITQRDFLSMGPDPITGKSYRSASFIRNAGIPTIDAVLQFKLSNLFIGFGGEYKTLLPRLKDLTGKKTDEKINSFTLTVFGKLNLDDFFFQSQFVYGQNLADITMLGGYAAKALDSTSYTNSNTMSVWGEIGYGKPLSFNLFVGYTKYLGTDDNVTGDYFYMGNLTNVDYVYRIAPNVQYTSGSYKIVAEVDYTTAGFGLLNKNNKSEISDVKAISNVRVALATIFYF